MILGALGQSSSLTDEGRYRLLVDAITDYAVYMLDPEGRISSWNAGAQRFKGYSEEEVLGRHFSLFYTEEDRRAGLPERVLATAAKEGRYESEGWRIRKDGTRFWTHAIVDPIRDPSGNLLGYAKVTRDLTERKKAERALEEAREALFHTQKMEAIGQLTGGVAHDFNNLLMVILTSLDLLRKRVQDDPKALSLIDNATKGAQRGAVLTERMLAFARRQEVSPKPVDLPHMVAEMSTLLRRSLDPAIHMEFQFPQKLPRVLADQNQLETALLNLVVNARDAMPNGGNIVIKASEEFPAPSDDQHNDAGHFVCFSVTDDGEGMDSETRARATEPFFTTKGIGKGTGLGLSMVQGLAEQWGGRLNLRSTKHVGTTVEIWLPVAHDDGGEPPDSKTPVRDVASHQSSLRVLVVDDDPLVLMGTSAMLEDLGHSVIEATSGTEAIAILRDREEIDVMVTDQAMPKMTGLELIERVVRERPDLPVILASGYAEIQNASARLELPRLSKPFTQAQLEKALLTAVGHPRV